MITNHETGECSLPDCFCHEAQRLEPSPDTTVSAPDFEREWRHAPTAHVRYTEKSEAEWWLMRGVWLGIQYERERGLVAMNGDLKEMQRMARERVG